MARNGPLAPPPRPPLAPPADAAAAATGGRKSEKKKSDIKNLFDVQILQRLLEKHFCDHLKSPFVDITINPTHV